MKKFLFLVAFGFAVSARAQSTLVVTSSNYPVYPVGSTNVPISLDSGGRMILSAGSGVAAGEPKKKEALVAQVPKPSKVTLLKVIIAILFL